MQGSVAPQLIFFKKIRLEYGFFKVFYRKI